MLSHREEREARRKSPSEAQIFYVTKESIQEPAEVSEMATLVSALFVHWNQYILWRGNLLRDSFTQKDGYF